MANGLSNLRVEYSLEATVKVADFEFVKPGYKVSADVEDGVHPSEAKRRLKALVEGWLEEEIDSVKEELKVK